MPTKTRPAAAKPKTVEHPDAPASPGQIDLIRKMMRERGLKPADFPPPRNAGEAGKAIDFLKDTKRFPRAPRPKRTVQVGFGVYRHSELLWVAKPNKDTRNRPDPAQWIVYGLIYAGWDANHGHQWEYEKGGIFVLAPGERVELKDPEIVQILRDSRQCLICNAVLPGRSRTLRPDCARYFGKAET